MAKRRSGRSGGGGVLGKAFSFFLWAVLIGAMLIAFFGIPHDAEVNDLPGIVKSKSDNVQVWFDQCFPKLISGEDTTGCLPTAPEAPGSVEGGTGEINPTTSEIMTVLGSLRVEEAAKVDYDRDEWDHWVAAPNAPKCFSVRQQVLYDEAEEGTVILGDKNDKTVDSISKACKVLSGTWIDKYSGETFTNPKDLDIDHMIPLSYAAQHGGQDWSKEKKQEYANDLSNSYHLIAVKASENRSKGDKGPSAWKPSNQAHWCQYATDWVNISKNYDLSVAPADVQALTEMLNTCPA